MRPGSVHRSLCNLSFLLYWGELYPFLGESRPWLNCLQGRVVKGITVQIIAVCLPLYIDIPPPGKALWLPPGSSGVSPGQV
jgi:hypothetical protein